MHERLLKAGCPGPFDTAAAASIGAAWYWAAAQKAESEVTREDCGRQLAAEYGVDPLRFYVEPSEAEKAVRKRRFKEASMQLKKEMLKTVKARPYVKVEASGEPVWDEAVSGEFAVVVERIAKEGY